MLVLQSMFQSGEKLLFYGIYGISKGEYGGALNGYISMFLEEQIVYIQMGNGNGLTIG